jgi:hypothetical protein
MAASATRARLPAYAAIMGLLALRSRIGGKVESCLRGSAAMVHVAACLLVVATSAVVSLPVSRGDLSNGAH